MVEVGYRALDCFHVFYLYRSVRAYLSTNSNLFPKLNNSSQSWLLIEAPGTSSAAQNVSGLASSWLDCQNLKWSAHFSICMSENQTALILAKWMLFWFMPHQKRQIIYCQTVITSNLHCFAGTIIDITLMKPQTLMEKPGHLFYGIFAIICFCSSFAVNCYNYVLFQWTVFCKPYHP